MQQPETESRVAILAHSFDDVRLLCACVDYWLHWLANSNDLWALAGVNCDLDRLPSERSGEKNVTTGLRRAVGHSLNVLTFRGGWSKE